MFYSNLKSLVSKSVVHVIKKALILQYRKNACADGMYILNFACTRTYSTHSHKKITNKNHTMYTTCTHTLHTCTHICITGSHNCNEHTRTKRYKIL